MRIHHLEHVPFEGLGTIEEWARSRGHEISRTRLHAGEPLPAPRDVGWLVVTGGPMGADDEEMHPWLSDEKKCIAEMIDAGKTVLGICLGAQLVAEALGARVSRNRHREIGWFPVELVEEASCTGLFRGFPRRLDAFHWHGDTFDIPAGAVRVARSEACENQAFVYDERIVALQFHLETTPEAAAHLIESCAGELAAAPFIQSAQEMLADERRFRAIREALDLLLGRMEKPPDPYCDAVHWITGA